MESAPPGPEFSPLRALAAEMGLRVETLVADTRSGEVTGIRLYHRRWVVHRPTFAAWWAAKCRLEAECGRPLQQLPGNGRGYGHGGGVLARAASSL